jgi:Fe2+ or Zn2+ uptake regulation protein
LKQGARTPAALAPLVFPHAREHQLFLTLSEVMGNLEVLEEQGKVHRHEREGRILFSLD